MVTLRRWAILGVMLSASALANVALAGGRASCRAEFGIGARLVCYAEQTLWTLGPLELSGGIEYRSPDRVTPYTALLWYAQDWWLGLEWARVVTGTEGWRLAVSGGLRW